MTFTGCVPVSFGKFYPLFQEYWHYSKQRDIMYSTFEVFIKRSAIHLSLTELWNENKWDIKELNWTFSRIDSLNTMLNLTNFLGGSEFAFLFHAKNYFYLENTNF